MATNLNIDQNLLESAKKLGGGKTKKETVNKALEEYIRRQKANEAEDKQFELLKTRLSAFEDLPITSGDYEKAAFFYNTCRINDIQGSHVYFFNLRGGSQPQTPHFYTG